MTKDNAADARTRTRRQHQWLPVTLPWANVVRRLTGGGHPRLTTRGMRASPPDRLPYRTASSSLYRRPCHAVGRCKSASNVGHAEILSTKSPMLRSIGPAGIPDGVKKHLNAAGAILTIAETPPR